MSKLMKQTGMTIALIVALPSLGLAVTAEELDTNGDGFVTFDEAQAVFPDLQSETFTAMDLNADGALDTAEMAAAQEAGLMPATDG